MALNAGVLVSTVLDVVRADMPVAILDASGGDAHAGRSGNAVPPDGHRFRRAGEKRWSCRLAGKSCLAGDVIGEYSFDEPLKAGDRLVFTDMAIYSMVKTTTFNGLRLPSIVRWNPETDETRLVRESATKISRCGCPDVERKALLCAAGLRQKRGKGHAAHRDGRPRREGRGRRFGRRGQLGAAGSAPAAPAHRAVPVRHHGDPSESRL